MAISKIAMLRKLVKLKNVAKRLSVILSVVSVPFGLVYGVIQYERSKLDGQVKQTLSFYDKFNSAPFVGYRESLTDLQTKYKTEIEASYNSNEAFTNEILKIVKTEGVERSLNMTFDFFDGLAACIKTRICDRESAQQLFKSRADEIYMLFYPYIYDHKKNKKNKNYAEGIEYIARRIENNGPLETLFRKVIAY